jgi:predicted amidophosphoribosyltransferase
MNRVISVSKSLQPKRVACPCCEQGLIRIAICEDCFKTVAICDDCEAIWKEPLALKTSTPPKPDGQHPLCPHCGEKVKHWVFPEGLKF